MPRRAARRPACQPWVLPILEFEIDPRPEPLGPDDADQEARCAALTTHEIIAPSVHDIVAGADHRLVDSTPACKMTAKDIASPSTQPGSRRYEIVVTV